MRRAERGGGGNTHTNSSAGRAPLLKCLASPHNTSNFETEGLQQRKTMSGFHSSAKNRNPTLEEGQARPNVTVKVHLHHTLLPRMARIDSLMIPERGLQSANATNSFSPSVNS